MVLQPAPAGSISIHRAHALPATLAETFLEKALDQYADPEELSTLPRMGAWETNAVEEVNGLLLLASGTALIHGVSSVPNLRWLKNPLHAFSAFSKRAVLTGDEAYASRLGR